MEQRAFLFTTIPIVAIIIIFGYLNIQQEKSLNPIVVGNNQDNCQSIHYGGEDRIDILFISTKEEAEHYTNVLFETEPYKTYKDYFNTYVLEEKADCEYYQDIAILCNTKNTQSLAKQCNHDYIIAVKEDDIKIRSSAYGNVMSINSAHEDSVLIHEMGHALGNLAEEYTPAKIPYGSKNCVSSCDNFNLEIDECRLGCSKADYFRSIPDGVMRTLTTSNYGIYNIALLKDIIEKNKPKDSTITGNQISEKLICDSKVFRVELLQSEDSQSINTENILESGCIPDKGLAGGLCVGEMCNINTLFTDSQDIINQETLEGEMYSNPETPLIFYIEQNPSNQEVEIILNDQQIAVINTAEAGATACKI